MGGFLNNFEQQAAPDNPVPDPGSIMGFYTRDNLPILSGLAAKFAVSDAWYCSVPSQTYTNRAFSLAGTSQGTVDNISKYLVPFRVRTIFNALSDSGDNDWAIYYQDGWLGSSCFTNYQFAAIGEDPQIDLSSQIQPFANFLAAAQNGTLPSFSYLEPAWYGFDTAGLPSSGTNGNDYHPPGNIAPGEINLLYTAMAIASNAEAWQNTLFIVTFDEHGGTMDHVPPPATIAPDQQTSSEGFDFTRLGIRVPTLLISPLVQNGMVFRSPDPVIPFDHTSFIKTILGWKGIDVSGGMMGARAAQAPDFSGVLSASPVNNTAIDFKARPIPAEVSEALANSQLNDLQRSFTAALAHSITGGKHGNEEHVRVWNEMQSIKTLPELKNYIMKAKAGKG